MPEIQNTENTLSFEENLKRLSDIVNQLERGNLPLEKAVDLYGDGIRLSAVCRRQLDEAKIRITGDKPENKEEQ